MIAGTGITPCATCSQPFPPASAAPPVVDKALLDAATKPPPQIAGVAGIGDVPITMHQAPADTNINWRRVAALPPFQMFAAERMRNTSGKDSEEHALDYVRTQGGGADVFEAYCQWHAAKGYWKNETPLGEVNQDA